MNRKLIVSEQLNWPQLALTENESILKIIEDFIKRYTALKREKTLPKKIRKEKPTKICSPFEVFIKSHIRLGINSITKELESDPTNVRFLIVCRSCKPILTKHLYIMSSQSNVKAGCVDGLSQRLAKILNIKTVSAFAVCHANPDSLKDEMHIGAEKILSELSFQLIKNLTDIQNPFSIRTDLNKMIDIEKFFQKNISEKVDITVEETKKETETDEMQVEPMTISDDDKDNDVFGSDFISVGMEAKSVDWLPFNSGINFIQFNDEFNNELATDIGLKSNKRKLGLYHSANSEIRLNPMSIRYRATDKNRQKREKKNKEKSMKKLEQNKFPKKKN